MVERRLVVIKVVPVRDEVLPLDDAVIEVIVDEVIIFDETVMKIILGEVV